VNFPLGANTSITVRGVPVVGLLIEVAGNSVIIVSFVWFGFMVFNLKGLISNVLRDLFKQNFIDPVKGTLKSSLNYTTMLNSVKKVLLKSKDKLLRLKQRVGECI
jgi:hypothetical protein